MSQEINDVFSNSALAPTINFQFEEASRSGLTADQLVENLNLVRQTGLPESVIKDFRHDAIVQAKTNQINRNSLASLWAASDSYNAKIAYDDTERIVDIFNQAQAIRLSQAEKNIPERTWYQLQRGALQVQSSYAALNQALYENIPDPEAFRAYDIFGEDSDLSIVDPEIIATRDERRTALEAEFTERLLEIVANREDLQNSIPPELFDSNFFYDFIETIPQMGSQIGASIAGALVGGPTGAAWAGAAAIGTQIVGGQYGGLRDQGVDPGLALRASSTNAALQIPLERIQLGALFKIFRTSGLGNVAKATIQGGLTNIVTETIQNFPEAATEIYALGTQIGMSPAEIRGLFFANIRDTFSDGLYEGFLTAPWSLLGGVGRLSYERAVRRKDNELREQETELFDIVQQSKAGQASPVLANAVLEGAGMNINNWIDADQAYKLYQSGNESIPNILNVTENELREAAGNGQDIVVNASRLISYTPDRATWDSLIAITKSSPFNDTALVTDARDTALDDIRSIFSSLGDTNIANTEDVFNAEIERLQSEAVSAISASPNLRAQIEASRTTPETVAASWANLVAAMTTRLNGGPTEARNNVIQRLRVLSLDSAQQQQITQPQVTGETVSGPAMLAGTNNNELASAQTLAAADESGVSAATIAELNNYNEKIDTSQPDYLNMSQEQQEEFDKEYNRKLIQAQNAPSIYEMYPVIYEAFGNLDGKSLRDYKGAYDEIRRIHGPGMFRAATKGGQPIEVFAANYNMEVSELVELLRTTKDELSGRGEKILYQPHELPSVETSGFDIPEYRGYVSITSRGNDIVLTPRADLTTLVHETGHVMRAELERVVNAGTTDVRLQRDLEAINSWLSRFDDNNILEQSYNAYLRNTPTFNNAEFSSLNAEQVERARNIARDEYFARGFELYLRDGSAPNNFVASAFIRFKKWLQAIYKRSQQLGVELSQEIVDTFNDLLSTEIEMNELTAGLGFRDLTSEVLDRLKIRGPERVYAAGLIKAAADRAPLALDRERRKSLRERRKKWAIDFWNQQAKMYNNEYDTQQNRDAQAVYTKNLLLRRDTNLDRQILSEVVDADTFQRFQEGLPQAIGPVNVTAIDPDTFATIHGYTSVSQMINDVLRAPTVEEYLREREAEYQIGVDPLESLFEATELDYQAEIVGRYLAAATERRGFQQQSFREYAQENISRQPVNKAIITNNYVGAMSRALKRERQAIVDGDFNLAFDENFRHRLNKELAKSSLDLRRNIEKSIKKVHNFIKNKNANPAARYTAMRIALRHGMVENNERLADGKDDSTVRNWLDTANEYGFDVYVDEYHWNAAPIDYNNLTVEGMNSVIDSLMQVIAVEKNMRTMIMEGQKRTFNNTIQELTDRIKSVHNLKELKAFERESAVKRGLKYAHASHMKMEQICILLDGAQDLGPNWQIYNKLNEADRNRGIIYRDEVRPRVRELFSPYTQTERLQNAENKIYVDALKQNMTKNQMIMFALNVGNDGNLQRLKSGFVVEGSELTDFQVQSVLDMLEERDMRLVQGIWDLFATFEERAFNLEESMNGIRPKRVLPRTVQTRWGEFPGGYFPVLYDHSRLANDVTDNILRYQPAAQMTSQRHLKNRSNVPPGTPLDLNLGRVQTSLHDIITDLTFRQPLTDVLRILKDTSYARTVQQAIGPELYRAMVDWARTTANERTFNTSGEKMARWARSAATTFVMGFKAASAVTQIWGITQSIDAIGAKWVRDGVRMTTQNGVTGIIEQVNWIRSVSPFMAQRAETFERDVADALRDSSLATLTPSTIFDRVLPQKIRIAENWLKKRAFLPMAFMQSFVDIPTWLGAYQKGLSDFSGDETRAISYADSIVRLTQGSGSAKDLARIQKGTEYHKLFTMFYTYFNTLYNLAARRINDVNMNRDAASVIRAANSFIFLIVMPAICSEIAAGRAPDDDEDYWTWSAQQILMYPFQTIVGVRTLAGVVEAKYGFKATPAQDAPAAIYSFLTEINKALFSEDYDAESEKLVRKGLRAAGYIRGLPLSQAEISVMNILDYINGTNGDFEIRDLIYKKQESRR